MDCPHKIPPSGTPVIHHKLAKELTMPDPVQDITMKTGTDKANPDHTHIFKNIAPQVITILTEAAQGHNTRIDIATTGAAHDDHAPAIEATPIDSHHDTPHQLH